MPLVERDERPNLARFARRGVLGPLATETPSRRRSGPRPPPAEGCTTTASSPFSKFLLPGMETSLAYGPYLTTPSWWNGHNAFLQIGNEPVFSTDRLVPAMRSPTTTG